MPQYVALIPAAGAGSRMGSAIPKQYLALLGQPMIAHTLRVFVEAPEIARVYVVLSPGDEWWPGYDWSGFSSKLVPLFVGGQTRAESVGNGLQAIAGELAEDDWVLVHDAARPCLTHALLLRMLHTLHSDPVGGLLAVPVADTLKLGDSDNKVVRTQSRELLWQAQTPQMFRLGLLRQALAAAGGAPTDEAQAVEALGYSPRLVPSDNRNFKVTYPDDLELAGLVLAARRE